MHVLILSKRNGQAQERLMQSAAALAEHFELDPALVEALKQTDKDVAVRALKEREAVADLFEALAIEVGAIKESAPEEEPAVTAVTDDAEVVPVPFTEGVQPGADELPPPVLEEDQAVAETVAEPEAVTEEAPAEEEPKPKSSKRKSTKKK